MKEWRSDMKFSKAIMIVFFLNLIINIDISNAGPYNYPNGPGTDRFKNESSYLKRVEMCNIPDSILNNMTTNDLIESIFQFPYIHNLFLFDNIMQGLNNLKSQFNGIEELFDRNDGPNKILHNYLDTNNKANLTRRMILEKFLAHNDVMDELSNANRRLILDTAFNRFQRRTRMDNFLIDHSFQTGSYLMLRILKHLSRSRFDNLIDNNNEIRAFAETSFQPRRSIIKRVILEIIRFRN